MERSCGGRQVDATSSALWMAWRLASLNGILRNTSRNNARAPEVLTGTERYSETAPQALTDPRSA
jgi:hypothetical protein